MAEAGHNRGGHDRPDIGGVRCLEPLGVGAWRAILREADGSEIEVVLRVSADPPADPRQSERFRDAIDRLRTVDHPSIQRVRRGGVLADGRPWVAVDPVDGKSLRQILSSNRLSMRQRLRIAQDILDAIQHAHGLGVVHGDLHAGRVVVEPAGEKSTVRITGFADAAAGDIGGGSASGADPRGDVLAASMVFVELAGVGLRGGRDLAAMRIAAANTPGIDRELQRIIEMAIADDPKARYRSADALQQDLERYRLHQPLQAGPGSHAYRLARSVRAHRMPLSAAAVLVVALLAGLLVVAQELGERREQSVVDLEEIDRLDRLVVEQAERIDRMNRVDTMNRDLLDGIGPDAPDAPEAGEGTLLVRAFGEALRLIDAGSVETGSGEFGPEIEAMIRLTVGSSMARFFGEDRAIEQLRAAVSLFDRGEGTFDEYRFAAQNELAESLIEQGANLDEAERLLDAALAGQALLHGESSSEVLATRANLGRLRQAQGRYEESAEILGDVHARYRDEMGPEADQTLSTASNLARAYLAMGGRADGGVEQRAYYTQARDVILGVLGEGAYSPGENWAPLDIAIRSILKQAHDYLNEGGEAVRIGDAIGDQVFDVLGQTNLTALVLRRNNCVNRIQLGRPADAEQGLREVIRGFERRDDPRVHDAYRWLGVAQYVQGRFDEAIVSWSRGLEVCDAERRAYEQKLMALRDSKIEPADVRADRLDSLQANMARYSEQAADLLRRIANAHRMQGRISEASSAIHEGSQRLSSLVRSPAAMHLRLDAEHWRIRLMDPAFTAGRDTELLTIARSLQTRREQFLDADSWVPQRVGVLLTEAMLLDRGGVRQHALRRSGEAIALLDTVVMQQGQWTVLRREAIDVHRRLGGQLQALVD